MLDYHSLLDPDAQDIAYQTSIACGWEQPDNDVFVVGCELCEFIVRRHRPPTQVYVLDEATESLAWDAFVAHACAVDCPHLACYLPMAGADYVKIRPWADFMGSLSGASA